MLTNINNELPDEHGSRLGFIIVLLFFVSIIAFAYYYMEQRATGVLYNSSQITTSY